MNAARIRVLRRALRLAPMFRSRKLSSLVNRQMSRRQFLKLGATATTNVLLGKSLGRGLREELYSPLGRQVFKLAKQRRRRKAVKFGLSLLGQLGGALG